VPELPDVEGFRRTFARVATGRRIVRVDVTDGRIVRNASAGALDRALRGRRFARPERHGKWMIARTDGPAVLLHFGMTGDVGWGPDARGRHRHDRVIFVLDRGEVRYRNMRLFGGVWLAHDRSEIAGILGGLGPDALGMRRDAFLERLARRRGGLKAALMDQGVVAGVGNIVADEVLWRARLHPHRRVEGLSEEERRRLHSRLDDVLRRSVRGGFVPAGRGWLTGVRGEPGASCPRCRAPLRRTTAAGRTTYFCARCQRPPRA
jgi:formamidopyrimidine-DNA glycosylase